MIDVPAPAATATPLVSRVHSALDSSPYIANQGMRVEEQHGAVRIAGKVGTYFEKQMAQEVVRRLDGVERVENQLEVNWN